MENRIMIVRFKHWDNKQNSLNMNDVVVYVSIFSFSCCSILEINKKWTSFWWIFWLSDVLQIDLYSIEKKTNNLNSMSFIIGNNFWLDDNPLCFLFFIKTLEILKNIISYCHFLSYLYRRNSFSKSTNFFF